MSQKYISDKNLTKEIIEFEGNYIFNNCFFSGNTIIFNSDHVVLNDCSFTNIVRLRFKDDKNGILILKEPKIIGNTELIITCKDFDLRATKDQIEQLKIKADQVQLHDSNIHKLIIEKDCNLYILNSNVVSMKTIYKLNSKFESSYVNNELYFDEYEPQNTIKKSSQS
jgi:hypothetical protein